MLLSCSNSRVSMFHCNNTRNYPVLLCSLSLVHYFSQSLIFTGFQDIQFYWEFLKETPVGIRYRMRFNYLHSATILWFLWSDSYTVTKRPGVSVLWNAFEGDCNPISQTTLRRWSEMHSRRKWTSVNAFRCWSLIFYCSSQNGKK